MKKLIVSALVCAMASFSAFADVKLEKGSIYELKNEDVRVNIVFDYSQCKIEGKEVDAFLKEKGEDWVKDYPMELQKAELVFKDQFNDECDYAQVIDSDAPYKIVVKIVDFDYGDRGAAFNPFNFSAKSGGAKIEGEIEVYKQGEDAPIAVLKIEDARGNNAITAGNEIRRVMAYYDVAEDLAKAIDKAKNKKKK